MSEEHKESPESISRRKFIRNTGFTVGGLAVGGILGSLLTRQDKDSNNGKKDTHAEAGNFNEALMYFTPEQFRITEAITERIFPEDDLGPGAKGLGVAYYIDHQLAGDWGFNAREYMQAPFFVGEKVQGYQGRLKRRNIFDIGLREIQNHSMAVYKKNFTDLKGEEQDAILKDFEGDKIQLTTISPSGFFQMLRSATLEGAYSDPLYGGNRNMDGWKMRKYPGSQMAYTTIIDKDFQEVKPQSLKSHMNH
ncbi:gluconate 2-dehydrogenase subunit 3 family protein [Neobacillus niacini]|uniref:gluconate 2-dehydrogenase subunit 3 family protein n=1 Tax=Neobacillus niacini TaxID=86668 RepID=UPI0021CB249E|nr:gluconate 2-dehydrogenase subunit 3 family protein [Neobacillus niacini]MCM3764127.1 gluconate 2-dehydrogenase subunit 3 family protein [Neobacillus niacini]